MDSQIVRLAAIVRKTYGLKMPDSVIAATALFTGTCVVTRNTEDFRKVPQLPIEERYPAALQRSGGCRCALLPWLMPSLTGGSRTRTRVPAEERRCAPVALRKLQVLACLGDVRASAEHNAVQGETPMPLYEKGDVRIHYEEVGAGFPLLVIPGGGLNSTVAGLATHPFNPMEEFKGEYRVIAADLRNLKGGESSGSLAIDRPWDAYTDDHLGLMDHLGISEFMVLGFCIGGPFIWNLLRRAPQRIVPAVLAPPRGLPPET